MQYETSNIYYLEVMTNVNYFKKKSQMSRSKNLIPAKRVLSQGILMRNIKALELTVQKLLAWLKFSIKMGQTQRSMSICQFSPCSIYFRKTFSSVSINVLVICMK